MKSKSMNATNMQYSKFTIYKLNQAIPVYNVDDERIGKTSPDDLIVWGPLDSIIVLTGQFRGYNGMALTASDRRKLQPVDSSTTLNEESR